MGELKVGLVSLGCSKNLVDSEVMLGFLREAGFEPTTVPAEADALIVNTCGFIESAKQESINSILEMAGYKQTGRCRVLAVAGCLSKRYAAELMQEIPEIDALVGVAEYRRLPEIIRRALDGNRQMLVTHDQYLYDDKTPRVRATPAYMAYVKVAEGCLNRCAYCAIPQIRGELLSRPMESVESEVRRLVQEGVIEVNLIAQDLTSYGIDLYGASSLARLVGRLGEIRGLRWLRLFYAYPSRLTDDLLGVIADSPAVCRYLDIPLQHSHAQVLRNMGRPGGRAEYLKLIEKVRTRVPGIALRSSFIVGYPGESESQFDDLLRFLRDAALDHVGVFKYSQEEGTRAAGLAGQIDEEIKEDRFRRAMEVQKTVSRQALHRRVGSEVDVLVTSARGEGRWVGRSEWQGPDVDGVTFLAGKTAKDGEICRVRITGSSDYDLFGQVLGTDGQP